MNYSFLSDCICITNFHTEYGFIFKEEEVLNPCQKQSFSYGLRNRCSFFEIHRKMYVLELFVNKVTSLQNYNFVKKRLQHRYFPLNLHFQEHLFYAVHLGNWSWFVSIGPQLLYQHHSVTLWFFSWFLIKIDSKFLIKIDFILN